MDELQRDEVDTAAGHQVPPSPGAPRDEAGPEDLNEASGGPAPCEDDVDACLARAEASLEALRTIARSAADVLERVPAGDDTARDELVAMATRLRAEVEDPSGPTVLDALIELRSIYATERGRAAQREAQLQGDLVHQIDVGREFAELAGATDSYWRGVYASLLTNVQSALTSAGATAAIEGSPLSRRWAQATTPRGHSHAGTDVVGAILNTIAVGIG